MLAPDSAPYYSTSAIDASSSCQVFRVCRRDLMKNSKARRCLETVGQSAAALLPRVRLRQESGIQIQFIATGRGKHDLRAEVTESFHKGEIIKNFMVFVFPLRAVLWQKQSYCIRMTRALGLEERGNRCPRAERYFRYALPSLNRRQDWSRHCYNRCSVRRYPGSTPYTPAGKIVRFRKARKYIWVKANNESALYAHKFNTLFWHDINDPEEFGFGRNQVTPFNIPTPDGETLYAWHILPLDVYTRNEESLRSEKRSHGPVDDPTDTSALHHLTSSDARVVVSCKSPSTHQA